MRQTKYIVYVAKELMEDPDALLDATMTHFIRKGVDMALRKKFMSHVMKRGYDAKTQLAVINDWVQVRDVATFPFDVERAGKDLAAVTKTLYEGGSDEDTPATGGVPVDNPSESEPESRTASDGGDTQSGKGNAGKRGKANR